MTATKSRHLLPAVFIMVSTLTLVACSDSSTSAKIEEQSKAVLNQAQEAADQLKTEMTETAQTAIDDAHAAVQESVASAKDAATESAAALSEKSSAAVTSAKNSVTEAGHNAVATVTEKAAETKAVVSEKVAALVAPAATVSHADGLELAKKSGCLACHSIDKPLMGPAWRDVANKYRGQSDAKEKLISSIAKGSRGNWGTVPMPANSPRISTSNIATLAEFVLSIE